jgi:hypothetical protein
MKCFAPGSRFACPTCGAADCPAYDTELGRVHRLAGALPQLPAWPWRINGLAGRSALRKPNGICVIGYRNYTRYTLVVAVAAPVAPGLGKSLRQPQRDGQREAWCLNWSHILGRAKSRPVGEACIRIDLRRTKIGRGHLGMRRRIWFRRRPCVSVGCRSWGQPSAGLWDWRGWRSPGPNRFG